MNDEPKCINCKATLRWERDGGEWKPNTYDANVAIRCLDCASLLCGPCGRKHFEESGLLATSRAALAASQAELAEAKSEIESLWAHGIESSRSFDADLAAAAGSLERARLALEQAGGSYSGKCGSCNQPLEICDLARLDYEPIHMNWCAGRIARAFLATPIATPGTPKP